MATAERVFQFSAPQTSAGVLSSLSRVAASVLGCWHRDMSRPFTHHGQTYRTCLGCGARRQFDLNSWESKGNFYFTQSR